MSKKSKKEENKDTIVEEHLSETQKEGVSEENVATQKEISQEEPLEEALNKEKDKFLRLFAEFENFKKRTAKERIELFKTASQDVMTAMLPVIDDFDRALAEIAKSDNDELFKGVELISHKLKETLKNKGLSEIEVAAGDVFDGDVHEAITQIAAPSEDMKGKIIDIIEKGYKLSDKVIRYPKVVVGQ
ncbi:nucleotide exchange factor GrpE [Leptobacterium sp. I13]|uniref:nucleotide exchange factor GrpE n=1 Tax=Leptobacterium meishanense TaxID=3128904 RepID=UPI0030EE0BEC